jgi:23S rRNA 5-hydroxycytidine C2501 synthase
MSMPIPIELLCPAKNVEIGIAAINHGADAVYIGYHQFGAREAAGNSLAHIEKLIKYAHIYHAKVYITINTLLYDNELEEVQTLIHCFHKMGADAIIIQDMGILEMELPPIPLYASTQTNNLSVERIKFLEDVGFKRVILARELSILEILKIRESTSVELEAFVHGALCVCYSGQCYFSYATSGRSANRGECAQPCRQTYNLIDEQGGVLVRNKHILSLKDLNQSDNILKLIDAGITSLKIEGRLKDIAYVKNITAHYRAILDTLIDQESGIAKASSGRCTFNFTPDPEKTFNRGYTQYFANGRESKMASFNTPKSLGKRIGEVISTDKHSFKVKSEDTINNNDGLCYIGMDGELHGIKVNRSEGNSIFPSKPITITKGTILYRNYDHLFSQQLQKDNSSKREIQCDLMVSLSTNAISLNLKDEDGLETSKVFDLKSMQPAEKANEMIEIICNQLVKSGSTPYKITIVWPGVNSETIPFIPIKQINEWRRILLDGHTYTREKKYVLNDFRITPNSKLYPENELSYSSNITNKLAKKFYARHGVIKFEDGFELLKEVAGKKIIQTRYCVLHEMGLCNGEAKEKKKLFLQDKKKKYPILVNCESCELNIYMP